jgi:hypothetical protein
MNHHPDKKDKHLKKFHQYDDVITNQSPKVKSIKLFTVLLKDAIPPHDQVRLFETRFSDDSLDCSGQEMKKTKLPPGEETGDLVMKPTQVGQFVWLVYAKSPFDNKQHTYTVRMAQ